jgi:hypothetical protein
MAGKFFSIEMLPARHGDCLWIEYGDDDGTNRILIDGGPVGTFKELSQRIGQMPAGEKDLELVVLSHVDADHVEGLVRLFAEKPLPVAVRSVWFNGWRQMNPKHKLLGAKQGEFLSALLVRRAPDAWKADAPPWYVPSQGKLPELQLPGGMTFTLLSPSAAKLKAMAAEWKKKMEEEGLTPGDLDAAWEALAKTKKFLPKKGLLGAAPSLDKLLKKQFAIDQAEANGSSIAMLAEYGGKSALLLADAHPDVVAQSIKRLCAARKIKRLHVDVVKVAHHGSKANTDEGLLNLIDCRNYLISTNGAQFKHPDKECLARILKFGKPDKIYFNYRSTFTRPWIAKNAQQKHKYSAVVRPDKDLSLRVEL